MVSLIEPSAKVCSVTESPRRPGYGLDQVVWPGLITKSVENVKSSSLTEEELQMVFYSNAARILRVSIDKQELGEVTPPK